MARLISWNYHQEDWRGKNSGILFWMRLYDASNALVFDTGRRSIDGENNYENGTIGGNFSSIKRMAIRWLRDTRSNGGGYWRVWVTDDLAQKYLVVVSRQCRTGSSTEEQNIDLGSTGWDSGWTGYGTNWRVRRVQIYNSNACISVCTCNNGNCTCRGNNICDCQSGRCGSYSCTCHNRCSNDCASNKNYGCVCETQKVASNCNAHCTSHDGLCLSNSRFNVNSLIYSSDIDRLGDDIKAAGKYVGTDITTNLNVSGEIKSVDITNMNTALKKVYDKVKELNPKFAYDYSDITDTLPTAKDSSVRLATYKKMSDLAVHIPTLCKAFDTCTNNCPSYSTCSTNCTCNNNNPGNWVTEGWTCPCNSQCSCNGHCSGVCTNCSCNAQNSLPADCRIV